MTGVAYFGFTSSATDADSHLSLLTENVEALAAGEGGASNITKPYQTMAYCPGTSKMKWTCTYETTSTRCTREEC